VTLVECGCCRKSKNGTEFKKCRTGEYLPWCKECIKGDREGYAVLVNERNRVRKSEWRLQHIDRLTEERRLYYEENRPGILSNLAAYRGKFREHAKARRIFNNAVSKGDIKRLPCFVCGVENSEGHHADYSQPLDVVWLCRTHHRQTHALVNSKTGELR
jgi:hypothetical protein